MCTFFSPARQASGEKGGWPLTAPSVVLEGVVVPWPSQAFPELLLPPMGTLGTQVALGCSRMGQGPKDVTWVCRPNSGPLVASGDHTRPVGSTLRQVGLATSYAVWAASRSFAAFLASRVIGGISKGNVSLSTAIIADLGSPSARSRGMVRAGDRG